MKEKGIWERAGFTDDEIAKLKKEREFYPKVCEMLVVINNQTACLVQMTLNKKPIGCENYNCKEKIGEPSA